MTQADACPDCDTTAEHSHVDCAAGHCPYVDREHWHLAFPDGAGAVLGADGLIDLFDLTQPARCIYPVGSPVRRKSSYLDRRDER